MYISEKKYIMEVGAILQEGVDFTADDLEPNALVAGRLLELSSSACRRIAYDNEYEQISWVGHYDPVSKTVKCTFKKPIYVDEESGKILV